MYSRYVAVTVLPLPCIHRTTAVDDLSTPKCRTAVRNLRDCHNFPPPRRGPPSRPGLWPACFGLDRLSLIGDTPRAAIHRPMLAGTLERTGAPARGGAERSPPRPAQRAESPRAGRSGPPATPEHQPRAREGPPERPAARREPETEPRATAREPRPARGRPEGPGTQRSPQRAGGTRRASTGPPQRAQAGGRRARGRDGASAPEDGDARGPKGPTARRRTAEAQKGRAVARPRARPL